MGGGKKVREDGLHNTLSNQALTTFMSESESMLITLNHMRKTQAIQFINLHIPSEVSCEHYTLRYYVAPMMLSSNAHVHMYTCMYMMYHCLSRSTQALLVEAKQFLLDVYRDLEVVWPALIM